MTKPVVVDRTRDGGGNEKTKLKVLLMGQGMETAKTQSCYYMSIGFYRFVELHCKKFREFHLQTTWLRTCCKVLLSLQALHSYSRHLPQGISHQVKLTAVMKSSHLYKNLYISAVLDNVGSNIYSTRYRTVSVYFFQTM